MPEQDTIVDALKTVIDPELNVNIVDLGLIYTIQSREDEVDVEMTLTTPACPAGPGDPPQRRDGPREDRGGRPRRTSSW